MASQHAVTRVIQSKRPAGPHRALVATYTCECGCYAGTSTVAYATESDLIAREQAPSCPVVQVHRWLERNPRGTQEMAAIALGIEPETVSRAFAERSPRVILNGKQIDFAAAVALMDDELRERAHAIVINDEQAFLDCYCSLHAEKYGEEFQVG